MSNKLFDILKWVAIMLLPTLGWLYGEIGTAWGWPYIPEITLTLDRLGTALAILLGISNLKYKQTHTIDIIPVETNDDSTAVVEEKADED